MRALYTAATGMMAQELNVQVISNNIANVRTNGFKRQRVHFQDLLYENLRRAGSATSDQGTQVPAGVAVGSGVKTVATGRVMSQGNLTQTDKEYDLSVRGDGFFRVRMPDGRTAYTRDGSFDLDSQGQLVTKDGYIVEPGINVPQNSRGVTISASGQVQALVAFVKSLQRASKHHLLEQMQRRHRHRRPSSRPEQHPPPTAHNPRCFSPPSVAHASGRLRGQRSRTIFEPRCSPGDWRYGQRSLRRCLHWPRTCSPFPPCRAGSSTTAAR
jgi:flagellar hook-basal body protein